MDEQAQKICHLMGVSPSEYEAACNTEQSATLNGCSESESDRINRLMGLSVEPQLTAEEMQAEKQSAANFISSDQEMAICRQMGVDPQDYLDTKAKDLLLAKCRLDDGVVDQQTLERVAAVMGISAEDQKTQKDKFTKDKEALTELSDDEIKACWALGINPGEYWHERCEAAGLPPGSAPIYKTPQPDMSEVDSTPAGDHPEPSGTNENAAPEVKPRWVRKQVRDGKTYPAHWAPAPY